MAWLVHIFTASGAVFGLLALEAISNQQFVKSFWLMGIAVLIDSIDGTFARWVNIKYRIPQIDGALLDNIVDYFTYVIIPSFFILKSQLLPDNMQLFFTFAIPIASAYQFCQKDAKTEDCFFKGFPSYWNIVIFYFFVLQTPKIVNGILSFILVIMIFIPIKYVYPSRISNLSNLLWVRLAMQAATLMWGGSLSVLLWYYPEINLPATIISITYILIYILVSIYRTFIPLKN
ncbi:MAG: phosphatidylcholine synthase [Desulfobacterales bacterium]|nr:phosphatidylcholine synthase [Desulfobacterales bacterium]